MEFRERYAAYAKAVEEELDGMLPPNGSAVCEAMRYSLLGGGKRLRGVLVLSVFDLLGGTRYQDALKAACAVEMIHASSLIHDDLPCMDDDGMRRGKPSCHVAFGEAMALLAGDALMVEAFRCLSRMEDPAALGGCLAELSYASGREGMMLGQELDLTVPETERDAEGLDRINRLKTGMLIRAAVRMGYHCSGCADENKRKELDVFAERLGRAFQISDDILDMTASSEQLGKPAGSDEKNGIATYASVYGPDRAYAEVLRLSDEALRALAGAGGEIRFLQGIVSLIINRKN